MEGMRVQPAILRKLNERRVLNAIRLRGTASRTDIQKDVHLTLPTISRIVDSLVEQGWVRELGIGDTSMGRPPILVEVDPTCAVAVGIELGRTAARLVYVNLLAEALHEESVDIASIRQPSDVTEFIRTSLVQTEALAKNLIGVGVAAPKTDHARGHKKPFHGQTEEPLFPWRDAGLAQYLESVLGLPAWVENDANAAALGEIWFGKGRDVRQLVFVLSDVGVGAGIGINGSIYGGAHDLAGEFTDSIVDIHADPCECGCGQRGLVGMVAHTAAIRAAVRKARGESESISLSVIIDRAKAGVQPEHAIVSRTLDYLAVGIVNLIRIVDPSMVVLGGSTLLSDPYMVDQTSAKVRQYVADLDIPIEVTRFRDSAVAIGAATLVLQHVYDHTRLIELTQSRRL